MWTSDRRKTRQAGESWVDWGEVTLEGDPAGAYLDGERRQLAVYGPGGYCWKPALGDRVLVLKAGQGGESPCVAGKRQGEAADAGRWGGVHLQQRVRESGLLLRTGRPSGS